MLRYKQAAKCYVLLLTLFICISQLLLKAKVEQKINVITNLPREPLHNMLKCVDMSLYNGINTTDETEGPTIHFFSLFKAVSEIERLGDFKINTADRKLGRGPSDKCHEGDGDLWRRCLHR